MSATQTDEGSVTEVTHEAHHPTPRLYVQIAVILGVLTAMEVSTYFVELGPLALPLLVVLMSIKFVLVAGFFMHLKFDTRVYTRLMGTGLSLAVVIYVVVLLTFLRITPSG